MKSTQTLKQGTMLRTGIVSPNPSITRSPVVENETARYEIVRNALLNDALFHEGERNAWRVARHPFPLSPSDVEFFQQLGNHLLAFYRSLNRLYQESVKGRQPAWVHQYFDQGKPEALLSFARMNRFRNLLPHVIRPDMIPTEDGLVMTELDSVPGGIGQTGSLSNAYGRLGEDIVGGTQGLSEGFAHMIRQYTSDSDPTLAIVVSDEAESYRPEMQWLASQLTSAGLAVACVHPRELRFSDSGLFLPEHFGERRISLVYRFFELFDLLNIPKSELIMYAAKKGLTAVSPPYKPWLEEKLAFALVHHPMLEQYWNVDLSDETFQVLKRLMPQTWILDPQPIPPMGVIPGLRIAGQPVSDWRMLGTASQKERQYVVKPSGFSELAWGSRGVSIGHDLSQTEWTRAIETGLDAFSTTPYILQVFHKGLVYSVDYYNEDKREWSTMEGRTRLSPYYFVDGDEAKLAGILATVCPKDKKIIHGMSEAIMVPCGIGINEHRKVQDEK